MDILSDNGVHDVFALVVPASAVWAWIWAGMGRMVVDGANGLLHLLLSIARIVARVAHGPMYSHPQRGGNRAGAGVRDPRSVIPPFFPPMAGEWFGDLIFWKMRIVLNNAACYAS